MKTRFKGHETFYFRDGWLSKALYELDNKDNKSLFRDNTSIMKLGVGANMVNSIKYWMLTSNLMKYDYKEKRYILTPLGNIIANEDIFLEDFFTLWIIHLNIVRNFDMATTWNIFFNKFKADSFKNEDVNNIISNYLDNNEIQFNKKSLESDISVLLRMYSTEKVQLDPEENTICPLSQLEIIKKDEDNYLKVVPDTNCLDELIILCAIKLLIEDKDNENYISFNDLEFSDNSLINIFNINKVIMLDYLDKLSNSKMVRVERTAGLDMVYIITDKTIEEIVQDYYKRGSNT